MHRPSGPQASLLSFTCSTLSLSNIRFNRAPPVYLARVEHLELVDGLARLGEFRKDEWELLHDDDMQPDWVIIGLNRTTKRHDS